MVRKLLAVAVFVVAASAVSPGSAKAQGTLCSFSGSGTSGVDCLGHTWTLGNGGWGIPGVGLGSVPWLGSPGQKASDFHFSCLAGCGPIVNNGSIGTRFSLSPFGSNDWTAVLGAGGTSIDFFSPDAAHDLSPGQSFFVNVSYPTTGDFRFEASWTTRATTVTPEPSSIALMGCGLAGLVFAGRKRIATRKTA